MYGGRKRIDDDLAARMLLDGASVLDVAHHFRVAPQAVYRAIGTGRLPSPSDARRSGDVA